MPSMGERTACFPFSFKVNHRFSSSNSEVNMQTFVEENENIILYFCALDGEKVPVEIANNATVTQLRVCMRSRHSPA